MNEEQILAAIKKETGLLDEQVDQIGEIIEKEYDIDGSNKEKIISGLKDKLGLEGEKAEEVYESVMRALARGVTSKLKEMLDEDEDEDE